MLFRSDADSAAQRGRVECGKFSLPYPHIGTKAIMRGRDLERAGDFLGAEAAYRFASLTQSEPVCLLATGHLGMLRLAQGRYAEAWPLLEATRGSRSGPSPPVWDGAPLRGRTIAVVPEQGFGDIIMVARWLPQLKECGAGRVIVVPPQPLVRLLGRIPGIEVYPALGPAWDGYSVAARLLY